MDADARERAEQLHALALFRHLPGPRLEELARVLVVRRVPAADIVFEDGSPGDALFLLAQGRVRIDKRLESGDVAELALLSPGDVFGEMALIERVPHSARAVAVADTTLFVLARPDLERWLRSEPQTAVGFFVELLRVLSQRLRRSSQGLVFLYDLSHLAIQRFDDEATFVRAVLHRARPHLEGDWSLAGYLYSEFNDEVTRVGTDGPRGERLPDSLPIGEAASRWLDAATYCVALAGASGTPLGFLVARNEAEMSQAERAEVEVALGAAGHLVASAIRNIRHDLEEGLRARLQHQQTFGSSP